MLKAAQEPRLTYYPVPKAVGSPKNDTPNLVEPITPWQENSMLAVLVVAIGLALLPLLVFWLMPSARRRGTHGLLPWLSGAALAAIAILVVLVNAGIVSP